MAAIEYDEVSSKERLTGRAFFLASGDNGWIDLGNIQLMNLDYGIKRKEHMKARRGILIADRFDAYSATPRWEITGDEFTSSNLYLVFLGTTVADVSQSAGSVSITGANGFVVRKGKWVDLVDSVTTVPRYGLTSATMTQPIGKVEGYNADYVIDRCVGKLYTPWDSGLTDGQANCTVTYTSPAATFDKVLPPLSNLNRSGSMRLIEEDDDGSNIPKTVHDFPVSLSTDSGGQTKVDDYKSFKMIATITDPTTWSILKRNT